jgi:hypothetical protein
MTRAPRRRRSSTFFLSRLMTVTRSPASRNRAASARPMLDVGVLMTMDIDCLRFLPQRAEWLSNASEGIGGQDRERPANSSVGTELK